MDVDAFAIENMYSINYPDSGDETIALVNIGASVMNVNIMKSGTSVLTRDIPIGGNRYTEAIQRELGMTYDEAEATKKGRHAKSTDAETVTGVIEGVNAEVASEIARTIDYFRTTGSDGELRRISLCGGGSKVAGLRDLLGDRMGIPVELSNPFNHVDTSSVDLDPDALADLSAEAAVGVGLALRTVGDR
jgi:type IV pilus assembly protein PilM